VDIEDWATTLKRAWAPGENGVVIVYSRGADQISFSATDEIGAPVTRVELLKMFSNAGKLAAAEDGARHQVTTAVLTLSKNLAETLERKREANGIVTKQRVLLVSSTLAVMAIVGLLGWMLARWVRRADVRAGEFYHVPDVRVAMRFGAPFSGGAGGEVSFRE